MKKNRSDRLSIRVIAKGNSSRKQPPNKKMNQSITDYVNVLRKTTNEGQ